jgi:hypothetical protein
VQRLHERLCPLHVHGRHSRRDVWSGLPLVLDSGLGLVALAMDGSLICRHLFARVARRVLCADPKPPGVCAVAHPVAGLLLLIHDRGRRGHHRRHWSARHGLYPHEPQRRRIPRHGRQCGGCGKLVVNTVITWLFTGDGSTIVSDNLLHILYSPFSPP